MSTNVSYDPRESREESTTRPVSVTPRADAWEADDAFYLVVEMPGVDESHVDLVLEKNILTITGDASASQFEGLRPLSDSRPRQFRRAFRLPESIDGQQLDATVRNGELMLKMPKSQQSLRRKINVRQA